MYMNNQLLKWNDTGLRLNNIMPYGYIYVITNKTNNKRYVGQTTNSRPKDRWYSHLSASKQSDTTNYLHNAIRKDGINAFAFNVIAECNNRSELDETEIYYINKYDTTQTKYGYNMMHGGSWGKHTIKSKQRIRWSVLNSIKSGKKKIPKGEDHHAWKPFDRIRFEDLVRRELNLGQIATKMNVSERYITQRFRKEYNLHTFKEVRCKLLNISEIRAHKSYKPIDMNEFAAMVISGMTLGSIVASLNQDESTIRRKWKAKYGHIPFRQLRRYLQSLQTIL